MTTLNQLRMIVEQNDDYSEEEVVVSGYGKMKYKQVRKLANEQLESATAFAKRGLWDQAAKQIDMYRVFAKAAQKFEQGTKK